jgi:hypothetical protein
VYVAVGVMAVLASLLLLNGALTWFGRDGIATALADAGDLTHAEAERAVVVWLVPYLLIGLLLLAGGPGRERRAHRLDPSLGLRRGRIDARITAAADPVPGRDHQLGGTDDPAVDRPSARCPLNPFARALSPGRWRAASGAGGTSRSTA